MKILWVLPKETFPIDDGARVATHALAAEISKATDRFDVIYFSNSDNSTQYRENWQVSHSHRMRKIVFKSKLLKVLFWLGSMIKNPFTPLTCSPYFQAQNTRELKKILSEESYDIIVFDGLHPWASLRRFLKDHERPIIYRAHNVESEIWKTAAEQSRSLISLFLRWQSYLMKKLETELVTRSHQVWAISDEDEKYFELQNKNTQLVPVGMNFKESKKDQTGPIKLLFLGRMDWGPNKDGLLWFLKEVWPQILSARDDIELFLAGSGESGWLSQFKGLERTHFLGRVESIDELYESVDLSVIPIFYGSGTRIKVIEAVSKRVALLSTKMGVQGSGLQAGDYFAAQDLSEWVDRLKTITREEIMQYECKAFERLKPILEPSQIASRLIKSFHRD